MKKLIIVTFILFVLIISIGVYLTYQISYDTDKKQWRQVGSYGPFYFYNGTRYKYENISFFITEENDNFSITLDMSFNKYFDTISVKYNELSPSFKPNDITNKTGYYHIPNIIVKPYHHSGEYPKDIFSYNLSFWGTNDTYGKPMFNYFNEKHPTDDWNIYITGEWNRLFFTCIRTTEVSVYNALIISCIILFVIFIISISILKFCFSKCNDKQRYKNIHNSIMLIFIGVVCVVIGSIIIDHLLFQFLNYLSSQYVRNLLILWVFEIIVFLILIGYCRKYHPNNFNTSQDATIF